METIVLILDTKILAIYTFSNTEDANQKFIELCTDLGWDGVHNESEKLIESSYYECDSGILKVIYTESIHKSNQSNLISYEICRN